MDLRELYRLLALPPEIAGRLERTGAALELGPLEGCLEQMLRRETAEGARGRLKAALGEDPECMKMLYCQLECARRAWDRYRERGIPEQVYRDTMGCFPRFLAECRRKTGRMFFDRDWWTWRQTGMALFRVGALEYELRDGGVLAVHIPSDADLSPASVDRSLEQAEDFFRSYFPAYPLEQHTCCSWLLSPRLETLLPQNSNIRSFQRRFRILEEQPEDREYIQWLFQVPADTPYHRLPEGTSLQRRVKALLLAGGAIGCALGILKDSHQG